jgi:hypothetical protein
MRRSGHPGGSPNMQVSVMSTELSDSLVRLAGISAAAAVPALFLSGVALALFFRGAGDWWGPVNDVLIALTLLLLVLPILVLPGAVGEQAGGWFIALSYAAVAGIVVAAAGQLLLVAGRVSLGTSYVTGGVGILPLIAWWVAAAFLAFSTGAPPVGIGWWLLASLAFAALTVVAARATRGPVVWGLAVGMVTALCGWLVSLAAYLLAA